jgi:hypothetical protein
MSVGPRRGPVAGRQGALRCATSTHDHELAADRTQPRAGDECKQIGPGNLPVNKRTTIANLLVCTSGGYHCVTNISCSG